MKPRVFRDPVHGLIDFRGRDVALSGIIDTRAFQRLRRVRQVGFASLVYPGAEHSRFGHALGAFHIAGRVTTQLDLPGDIARDVQVAALVHDIGHGPYSHAWESALGGLSHEQWGKRILAEDDELRAALAVLDPALPARLEGFFGASYTPRVARKLVSSQLDVDRMDYLLRDAHYTGVGYSIYDMPWIVHALRVEKIRPGDDPEDLVIDYRRGMHAVEQYLIGRFYMYAQVYYHKTVRAAEWMFLKAMKRYADLAKDGKEPPGLPAARRLARGEIPPVAEYLALDDARVQVAFDDWAAGAAEPVLADLAGRLVRRRLFKTIDVGDDPSVVPALSAALGEAATRVMGERGRFYWAIDQAEGLGYAPKPGEEIFVVGHPRHPTIELGELIGELLGRQSFTIRAVFAPELTDAFAPVIKPYTRGEA